MTTTGKSALTTLVLALVSTTLFAQEYPKATGYVNDYARLLSHDEGSSLNQELATFENKTSIEIAVVIVSSLNGEDIEKYTRGLATAWGVGKRGQNNGVVFLIAPQEHKMRIETASGTRAILTDNRANEIRDETVLPRFKSGNIPGGIMDGTHAIMRVLDPSVAAPTDLAPAPQSTNQKEQTSGYIKALFEYVLGSVVAVVVALFLIVRPIRRRKARAYVLDKKERLAARFAEAENTVGHFDVQAETRDKFTSLIKDFAPIQQLTLSSEGTDWFETRKTLDSMDSPLSDITSAMKSEIGFAARARREGPELMKQLPRMIGDAEKRLAKGNPSPEALKYLERARRHLAQAKGRYSGVEVVDWVILYTILHNAQSNLTSAESSHGTANNSYSPNAAMEPTSSYGFGDSSGGSTGAGGFGGGGGFDSGGGGSSGSW